jgi:hypothetical protein
MLVCSGALPSTAVVQIAPTSGASSGMRIELKSHNTAPDGRRTLTGLLPRLVEDATYRITAGDAQLPLAHLRMIPLPIVQLHVIAQPPTYAGQAHQPLDPAARSASVLEGSSVQFQVDCTNHKPLKAVEVSFQSGSLTEPVPWTPQDEGRLHWTSSAEAPALTNIHSELRYEVHVTDDDGLSPQLPLRGVIRVRPDLLPTASVELIHRVVLPTARPVVTFRVADDYGIAAAELVVDAQRAAQHAAPAEAVEPDQPLPTSPDRSSDDFPTVEILRYPLPLTEQPVPADRLPISVTYPLDLAPLKLVPGDRLKLAVEITDYRGQPADSPGGGRTVSEAKVVEVSDESGVLAAIREADQRSETQLNDLIRRQLHIGEQP